MFKQSNVNQLRLDIKFEFTFAVKRTNLTFAMLFSAQGTPVKKQFELNILNLKD